MKLTVSTNDVTVYRQTVLREDGETWIGYFNLSDVDFSDSYSFPSVLKEDTWKFSEFTDPTKYKTNASGYIPETEIIIEVPLAGSGKSLYFPMSLEQFHDLATARLVNDQWQNYGLQEIIIAKDFLNKANTNLFCDTETMTIESTMQRRNASRNGGHSVAVEAVREEIEANFKADENGQYTFGIEEFANMFVKFCDSKKGDEIDMTNACLDMEDRTNDR